MADERIWTDVEYRLADEPEFIRPTGNSNFRQVENGIVIQNLFPIVIVRAVMPGGSVYRGTKDKDMF